MPKYKNSLINLRNQDKIKSVLGENKLRRIKDSIQKAVDSDNDIEPQEIDNSKYKIIMIDDVSGINALVVLYIIKSEFNIYTVAFKEFI